MLTKHRLVWAFIYRDQCDEYCMPNASSYVSSLTAAQLEWASTTPYLFARKLLSEDPFCLRERVIHLSSSMPTDDDGIMGLHILSELDGGRYLLLEGNKWIYLCDTGHPLLSMDALRPKVVASVNIQYDVLWQQTISLSPSSYLCCIQTKLPENTEDQYVFTLSILPTHTMRSNSLLGSLTPSF